MTNATGHMVKKVAVAQLKAHLAETLRDVEAGDRIAI
jgi:antitoxin (DNA-binding transcriptional repressor) of toxin-antitoxin stability system